MGYEIAIIQIDIEQSKGLWKVLLHQFGPDLKTAVL